MSYRHTLEAALESLHEIEDLVNGFPAGGKIPTVEIDLALQKLRNVYELMLMIREKDKNPPSTETRSNDMEINQAKPDIEEKPTEEMAQVALEETANIKPHASTTLSRTTSNITVSVEQNEVKLTETVVEKETTSVKKASTEKKMQTLSDQFKGRTTLLESLHQNFDENETLSHAKPVVDLMAAIGVNDRFTFIRELFNNDKKAFEGTIIALNEAGSFNNAFNYMIQEFSWDMNSEPVQLLLGIIRRKYIKGRHE